MRRRTFLKSGLTLLGGIPFYRPLPALAADLLAGTGPTDLVQVSGGSPAARVQTALEHLGGLQRFVRPGNTVFVKPNMSWDRRPEFAANTDPQVVAEVIRHCYQAGARQVIVSDRTCNEDRRCYRNSGIEQAAREAGAEVRFARTQLFEKIRIEQAHKLDSWTFHRDALEADVLINLPVLKSHSMARVTMGFKNMMGLVGENRGRIHFSFDEKITDINRVLRPALTLIDATRVLIRNGPSGGSLDDVVQKNLLLAGTDPVLVDCWGAILFGVEPETLPYLSLAAAAGLGSLDYRTREPRRLTLPA